MERSGHTGPTRLPSSGRLELSSSAHPQCLTLKPPPHLVHLQVRISIYPPTYTGLGLFAFVVELSKKETISSTHRDSK
jgi:hypothetical protein